MLRAGQLFLSLALTLGKEGLMLGAGELLLPLAPLGSRFSITAAIKAGSSVTAADELFERFHGLGFAADAAGQ